MNGMEQKQPILQGREPAAVLRFFEDICAIPHVSGDERALADYVEAFARARGIACYRDRVHNVCLRIPASVGHEAASAVLLQGHLDMVGEKDADSTHDFAADGLMLRVDADGWLSATGTTLGGDDGIAVAMMLAVLDCPPEPHPAIECLFTVSEETGLEGAWAFDPMAAGVTAHTMINLDSEAEGVVTAGCSGGVRTDLTIPVRSVPAEDGMTTVEVAVSELSGGHSGVEIHEGHTNAIKLLGRLLQATSGAGARLVMLSGGGKDNAIPREATATVAVAREKAADLVRALTQCAETIRHEPNIIAADRDFICTVKDSGEAPTHVFSSESHRAILSAILLVRDGVLSMSAHVKGLVAHSRNLGILTTSTDESGTPTSVMLSFSTRSASDSHLDASETDMKELAYALGCVVGESVEVRHHARYPGWDYAPVSPLRDRWMAVAEQLFGTVPRIEVIHAGLECGILSDKLTAALGVVPDIISVGPDMRDIHTPRERISIPSIERTYRLLGTVLSALA